MGSGFDLDNGKISTCQSNLDIMKYYSYETVSNIKECQNYCWSNPNCFGFTTESLSSELTCYDPKTLKMEYLDIDLNTDNGTNPKVQSEL